MVRFKYITVTTLQKSDKRMMIIIIIIINFILIFMGLPSDWPRDVTVIAPSPSSTCARCYAQCGSRRINSTYSPKDFFPKESSCWHRVHKETIQGVSHTHCYVSKWCLLLQLPPTNSLGVRMTSKGSYFPATLIRLHYKLHALQERKPHLLYSPCSLNC
jgi:hypothetical protein